MANLIVRNIDDAIVKALKQRASRHGISAEAEHRKILEQVLLHPPQKSFAEVLRLIPNVGKDTDFERSLTVSYPPNPPNHENQY
ncbi:FitA-like ribbon-helix-helix domain-containing protein [Coleofasciculus sp. F4-SAH-05]|uniref:FitA-like ribbon-helix-helix domain-containing protein n=1 Tax=Coleofasciculus sp. F4-SAH-05 TaxID=3069525 RepID=UPI0032F0C348